MTLTIGQVVYSLWTRNAPHDRTPSLRPTVVRKIGRKWFQCSTEDWPDRLTSYSLETLLEDAKGFHSNSRIVLSPQQWEEEKEAGAIVTQIRRAFDYSGAGDRLSLPDLRAIKAILDKGAS